MRSSSTSSTATTGTSTSGPLQADNEINPDVLGYIFEKYINQKQMGAYYTKEDITEYIAKNTIIPFLFDATAKKCPADFAADAPVWRLLREDPDRYIYPAVRRGVVDDEGNVLPESALPDFVRKGMNDPKARMFERRYNLGEADLSRRATARSSRLPTETWREYVCRRQRCLELREKLGNGEVTAINDLITLNLDIRQFAQDAIANCQSPELLAAFFDAIRTVTVLDPTCGSGAFLFAALNVLEPLYEACLDRMESFLAAEDSKAAAKGNGNGHEGRPEPTPRPSASTSSGDPQVGQRRPPQRQVFHLQVDHHPQPLRRGHHGGGHGNLQTAAVPQAGGPGRSRPEQAEPWRRAAARHRLQHPRRQHAGRLHHASTKSAAAIRPAIRAFR